MAKRELIDRKQAIKVVSNGFDRWHMINLLASQGSIPTITDQEIVKPYLEKLKAMISEMDLNKVAKNYEDRFYGFQNEILQMIDNLSSEREEVEQEDLDHVYKEGYKAGYARAMLDYGLED